MILKKKEVRAPDQIVYYSELLQVAAHTLETGHDFNFEATRIIAHDGSKTERELTEAWATDDNSVNRCIELAPAYTALRKNTRTADTAD
ncbi:unnamed protein product [Dibothriocephalus latus]|uniref:Uncharacterized protein n=1 Tax=Dibothriocephalus latus TaxID=60516 RepID=A0A3P7P1V4_DIBLA|nr:unnamed protein product [Dibothriocephalus latus]